MNDIIPFIIYFTIISIISVIITVYDKSAAKLGKRRIPEKALFLLAAVGGAIAMLITMNTIRHKTKHKRFMFGLPAIIITQFILIVLYFLK